MEHMQMSSHSLAQSASSHPFTPQVDLVSNPSSFHSPPESPNYHLQTDLHSNSSALPNPRKRPAPSHPTAYVDGIDGEIDSEKRARFDNWSGSSSSFPLPLSSSSFSPTLLHDSALSSSIDHVFDSEMSLNDPFRSELPSRLDRDAASPYQYEEAIPVHTFTPATFHNHASMHSKQHYHSNSHHSDHHPSTSPTPSDAALKSTAVAADPSAAARPGSARSSGRGLNPYGSRSSGILPMDSSALAAHNFSMRVKSACHNCKVSKTKCDQGRPCSRCVRTGKGDSCDSAPPPPAASDEQPPAASPAASVSPEGETSVGGSEEEHVEGQVGGVLLPETEESAKNTELPDCLDEVATAAPTPTAPLSPMVQGADKGKNPNAALVRLQQYVAEKHAQQHRQPQQPTLESSSSPAKVTELVRQQVKQLMPKEQPLPDTISKAAANGPLQTEFNRTAASTLEQTVAASSSSHVTPKARMWLRAFVEIFLTHLQSWLTKVTRENLVTPAAPDQAEVTARLIRRSNTLSQWILAQAATLSNASSLLPKDHPESTSFFTVLFKNLDSKSPNQLNRPLAAAAKKDTMSEESNSKKSPPPLMQSSSPTTTTSTLSTRRLQNTNNNISDSSESDSFSFGDNTPFFKKKDRLATECDSFAGMHVGVMALGFYSDLKPDETQRPAWSNQTVATMFGYNDADELDRDICNVNSFAQMYPVQNLALGIPSFIDAVFTGKNSYTVQSEWVHKNGHMVYTLDTISLFYNADGDVEKATAIVCALPPGVQKSVIDSLNQLPQNDQLASSPTQIYKHRLTQFKELHQQQQLQVAAGQVPQQSMSAQQPQQQQQQQYPQKQHFQQQQQQQKMPSHGMQDSFPRQQMNSNSSSPHSFDLSSFDMSALDHIRRQAEAAGLNVSNLAAEYGSNPQLLQSLLSNVMQPAAHITSQLSMQNMPQSQQQRMYASPSPPPQPFMPQQPHPQQFQQQQQQSTQNRSWYQQQQQQQPSF